MRISRERKPKGTRRGVRLVGAVLLGLPALWAAWEAPRVPVGGLSLMLLAAALAVPVGLLVRAWRYRVPFDLSSRLPRRLSVRARMGWSQRPFLGWTVSFLGTPRWAMGTEEDSVGVVGPPGVN